MIRTLLRYSFNVLSALSLLLCVAVLGLWVRSQFRYDVWYTLSRDDATGVTSMAELDSGGGRVFAQYNYQRQPATGEENRGWRHRASPKMGAAVKFDKWWTYNRGAGSSPNSGLRWWTLQLRLWPVIVVTALLPVLWIGRALRRRRQPRLGVCPRCGYDLRASKDRCPECGEAVPAGGAASVGVTGWRSEEWTPVTAPAVTTPDAR